MFTAHSGQLGAACNMDGGCNFTKRRGRQMRLWWWLSVKLMGKCWNIIERLYTILVCLPTYFTVGIYLLAGHSHRVCNPVVSFVWRISWAYILSKTVTVV